VSVTVYGASDDLIEVEGDIDEEFNAISAPENGHLLAFSDGTVLRIDYSELGIWRITPVFRSGLGFDLTIVQAPEDDDSNYSDRATLNGDITWVVHGDAAASTKGIRT
jgi:hypothetical protein